jgi:hypothetical protein
MKIKTAICGFLIMVSMPALAGSGAEHRVSFTSYGPATIGMTVPQLKKALGVAIINKDSNPSGSCRFVGFEDHEQGVMFMLENERVVRIDISNPDVRTVSGARIGDSKKAILTLYKGRVGTEPHAYDIGGYYLKILSKNKMHGISFSLSDGKIVDGFHVGLAEEINYAEGCS